MDESDYVEYNGPIEHIFSIRWSCIRNWPLTGTIKPKGMDDYMTTNVKFRRILEELYKNDYVLI